MLRGSSGNRADGWMFPPHSITFPDALRLRKGHWISSRQAQQIARSPAPKLNVSRVYSFPIGCQDHIAKNREEYSLSTWNSKSMHPAAQSPWRGCGRDESRPYGARADLRAGAGAMRRAHLCTNNTEHETNIPCQNATVGARFIAPAYPERPRRCIFNAKPLRESPNRRAAWDLLPWQRRRASRMAALSVAPTRWSKSRSEVESTLAAA